MHLHYGTYMCAAAGSLCEWLGHSRYKKVIAYPALPAPSRRRCCHRARRRGHVAARRWQRRSSGPVVRRMRSAEGRASRRAPDLHPTTVSRRSDNVNGLWRTASSRRPLEHSKRSNSALSVVECGDLVDGRLRPCGLAAGVTQSIDVVTAPQHRRLVEAARADQCAFVRSDAVDPRDRCACHLRWRGSGSGSPLRAVENADVLFNYHDPTTHTTSLQCYTQPLHPLHGSWTTYASVYLRCPVHGPSCVRQLYIYKGLSFR